MGHGERRVGLWMGIEVIICNNASQKQRTRPALTTLVLSCRHLSLKRAWQTLHLHCFVFELPDRFKIELCIFRRDVPVFK